MLDDKEIEKESLANTFGISVANPTFPEGFFVEPGPDRRKPGIKYHELRWHVFSQMGAENMFRIVRDYVFDFIKQLGDEESAYTKYIKDARLEISYPDILQSIIQGIEDLNVEGDYNHVMGDIYEYILDKMAANGSSGQFRTPPHIIIMMVEMMQPTVDDIICDPAMGTAGFLVESAKYLQEKFGEQLADEDTQNRFNSSMFNGFDTDPIMMRIGSMHLMLNNVKNPAINRRDSLSQNNDDEKLYTLTLANPPFAGSVNASSTPTLMQKSSSTIFTASSSVYKTRNLRPSPYAHVRMPSTTTATYLYTTHNAKSWTLLTTQSFRLRCSRPMTSSVKSRSREDGSK